MIKFGNEMKLLRYLINKATGRLKKVISGADFSDTINPIKQSEHLKVHGPIFQNLVFCFI